MYDAQREKRWTVYLLLLVIFVVLAFVMLCAGGCGSMPASAQQVAPSVTVESEGPAQVDAQTTSEMEQFSELGAKVEAVEGDLTMVRQGIGEIRAKLEVHRINVSATEERKERSAERIFFIGMFLFAVAAPSFVPERITLWHLPVPLRGLAYILGFGMMVASWFVVPLFF